MKLQAVLSYGWPDHPASPLLAATLHQVAREADSTGRASYLEALRFEPTLAARHHQAILGLDALFRRRTRGFDDLKQFLGALAQIPTDHGPPLCCEIDGLAWNFLKGAKNLDLLLPADPAGSAPFFKKMQTWQTDIAELERFERFGVAAPSVNTRAYLALRAIVTRPSARDERRALATLLVSGPSTLAEISTDLRLNYSLGERSLAVFEGDPPAAIERRGERFAIRDSAMPIVLFCLRETMGLDLLPALPDQQEA